MQIVVTECVPNICLVIDITQGKDYNALNRWGRLLAEMRVVRAVPFEPVGSFQRREARLTSYESYAVHGIFAF